MTIGTPAADSYAVSYLPIPMLNQLPLLHDTLAKQPHGETLQDWLQQFESVAQ